MNSFVPDGQDPSLSWRAEVTLAQFLPLVCGSIPILPFSSWETTLIVGYSALHFNHETADTGAFFCMTCIYLYWILLFHLTFFMVSLIIQQLYREILSVADENGGKLPNRAVFYCDEYGTRATRSQLKRLRAR